jgi:DNA-binding NtrC family response regulator
VIGTEAAPQVARTRCLLLHRDRGLATIWARFLEREGVDATLVGSTSEAFEALRGEDVHVLVLDIEAPEALTVADFAAYRCPDLPVISVSARTFFCETAIFQIIPNARSVLRPPVDPADMAVVAGHYAWRYRARAAARS